MPQCAARSSITEECFRQRCGSHAHSRSNCFGEGGKIDHATRFVQRSHRLNGLPFIPEHSVGVIFQHSDSESGTKSENRPPLKFIKHAPCGIVELWNYVK